MRTVDIIASGLKEIYKWSCPDCETDNIVTGLIEIVYCVCCGAEFETNPPEDAYED